ncbi:LLM class flavin-dependent oxidoreductase [Polynucleobacter kasalickyi]|uniref:Flavin-dependent oxidoreductase, luciferase family (Includes alkanesulfonate monooxygenase SsuD and methylene tetrahydromethanopterin reductase) n=1 Tax=Polynucleobacter kasalickyi TaxID=1938817 RepID=A0A1W1Y8Z0_9BURK|nr:LLM class flavin-dependent oxidoreductase [Polynucleobacter kasalickyi]SMC32680.1 Flavin-dependent oxidoreductase, luciferase family (includes alkanesulfonate monooxygenase SsuD and methylene tetrahydromethanopterin reductase) [Polynucleobacter kasalickyi]
MRLGYFTMPLHPLERDGTETLHEDRQTIILADQLGFYDAFVGEHLTDQAENVTNSMIFLATLIFETKNIKLGTGTSNLSHAHPTLIAAQAAMFDRLAKGRFIFGISPGALASDAEALGIFKEDRNKMFAEAIDVILAIWAGEPPYNIDLPDNRFKVSVQNTQVLEIGRGYIMKPLQKPYPEIVGTVVAPFSKGVIAMGQRDFHPMSANFLLENWLPSHWNNYSQGKTNVGQQALTKDWRVARTIFVADDSKTAQAYGKSNENSPYRYYYKQMLTKMKISNRHVIFKKSQEADDSTITLDGILDDLVICGTVNEVVDQILALQERIGCNIGEIVYAGMDLVDPVLGRRSMELMAHEVMPRVNEAMGLGYVTNADAA